jgi:hypothetical protein
VSAGYDGACSLFDPQTFTPDADTPSETIQLRFPLGDALPAQTFDEAVASLGPPWGQINESRETQIAGRRATYLDFVAGPGVSGGKRFACYVIDHDGFALSICTVDASSPGASTIEERVAFLEQVVATLQFSTP